MNINGKSAKPLRSPVPVIDLFAGPGGLGEGFSAIRHNSNPVFKIALSVEMDKNAYQTLRLRSFFRQFPDDNKPKEYYEQLRNGQPQWEELKKRYPDQATDAETEVWQAELGNKEYPRSEVDARIEKALNGTKNWVLIGGPPCQAYSVVGRVRMKGENAWKFARDPRHLLYKEYLHILAVHRPPVFVMENVKGILSSIKSGKRIVDRLVNDLRNPLAAIPEEKRGREDVLTYDLYALADYEDDQPGSPVLNGNPAKYIVRCERHDIPQARHRFFLLGVRNDIAAVPETLHKTDPVRMWRAISDLPRLRSRLSQRKDSADGWVEAVAEALSQKRLMRSADKAVLKVMKKETARLNHASIGGEYVKGTVKPDWRPDWFFDPHIGGVFNHSSRCHIKDDLWRYFYAACYAKLKKRSPRLKDLPACLLPDHENVKDRQLHTNPMFADRFRVQLKHMPSTTVTSHIRKDGHYFIHPDPSQCRSLTVREAARLQTFPDNYFFVGPRTSQYHQVGNAVPPLLALQIASLVRQLFEKSGK